MKCGLYRHYNGNFYRVIGVSRHSETLEELIVYEALYGEYGYGSGPVPCLKKLLFMKGSISHAFNIFIPWEKKHRN